MMAEMLKDPRYTQIGMDPRRHSQFYDKSTGLPVFKAEEKLQSGPLILAPRKDLEITDWNDPRLELTDFPGKKYAGGGKVNAAVELAKKIAPKFNLEAVQNMPVSSAQKQLPVAKAFQMLSSENVNPKVKQQIFKQYLQMNPDLVRKSGATNYDELTQAAYQQMAKETGGQFQALQGSGVKLSFDPTGEKAYKSSKEMLEDALQNKQLTVFQGGKPHPALGKEANEQFRAVHDYFGHGTTGASFGPKGEELAYGAHSQMYSPLARLAAATETRGQNSLVSYSGMNEELINAMNQLKTQREQLIKSGGDPSIINDQLVKLGQQFKYAPQKPLILPPEQIDINYQGFAGGGKIGKMLEHAKSLPFVHFSNAPSISQLDPRMYGKGIKGAEASRLTDAPDIKPRSYFYVDKPGVKPEQGLGPHKYQGTAENIYPLHEDPLGLSAIAKQKSLDPYLMSQGIQQVDEKQQLNELERLIKQAGYKGYANDDVGLLFYPTPVKKAE
jgi:organic radical activating enzyme